MVKNLPLMQETQVRSLGREDPMEKGAATHSSILAWRIPWTQECGGLQSIESQRVRHDWPNLCVFDCSLDDVLLIFFVVAQVNFQNIFFKVVISVTIWSIVRWVFGLPWELSGKESPYNAGDARSIPGSGRSTGKGSGNPPWYSCLEKLMGREAWRTTVPGVEKESDMTQWLQQQRWLFISKLSSS